MSLRLTLLNQWLRRVEKPVLARVEDPQPQRDRFEWQARWILRPAPGVWSRETTLGGRPALVVHPVGATPRTALLYLHGGAYVLGSPRTHEKLAGRLAVAMSAEAWLPDYRLAPEHRYPAALEDVVGAYRGLLELGFDRIVLAGDSAGGGLAFALLERILTEDLPRPLCIAALSPWTDLTLTGDSYRANRERDVMLPWSQIQRCASEYLGDTPARTPGASPLYGSFAGAPPVLIQVSRAEALMDDGIAMAARLEAQGVNVLLQSWDRTPHAWQIFHGLLPEADDAIAAIERFGSLHLAQTG